MDDPPRGSQRRIHKRDRCTKLVNNVQRNFIQVVVQKTQLHQINTNGEEMLTEELKYFLDHLNDKQISTANGAQALEVIKILVRASKHLMGIK